MSQKHITRCRRYNLCRYMRANYHEIKKEIDILQTKIDKLDVPKKCDNNIEKNNKEEFYELILSDFESYSDQDEFSWD